jgi:hypothetical protein
MTRSHSVLTAIVMSAMLLAGTAYAQAPSPQPTPASPSIGERLKTKVEQKKDKLEAKLKTKVERKEDKLEAKWKRKKQKLANCRQQAKDQDLHGAKRLKFIAKCMIRETD